MLPPQGDDEIEPIEAAIRAQLDDRLRIIWDARALITRPGYIDATGKTVPPEHDGRWKVIIRRPNEEDHCLYLVRWDGDGNEAYRAIGAWLIDFLHTWDRQNVHFVEEMRRMQAEEELQLRRAASEEDEETRDFWDRMGFRVAGEELIGRGFGGGIRTDTAPPTTTITPADVPTSASS